jgi:hypothetical protein
MSAQPVHTPRLTTNWKPQTSKYNIGAKNENDQVEQGNRIQLSALLNQSTKVLSGLPRRLQHRLGRP